MTMRALLFICIAGLLTAACSSSPFKQEGVNRNLTPALAKSSGDYLNQSAIWGGLIIETRNHKDFSEVEVLAYPLDSASEPVRSATAQGRFLITHSGFLEPAEFAPGRWISVLGMVRPPKTGNVGSTPYEYPVIQSRQLHLWSEDEGRGSDSRIRFGIGIGIHL